MHNAPRCTALLIERIHATYKSITKINRLTRHTKRVNQAYRVAAHVAKGAHPAHQTNRITLGVSTSYRVVLPLIVIEQAAGSRGLLPWEPQR